MIKIKALINFLVLSMVIVASLSVCIGGNSASSSSASDLDSDVSIYNSTSADTMFSLNETELMADPFAEVSIYNSTDTDIFYDFNAIDSIDGTDSINASIFDGNTKPVELVEYIKVPIDEAYSKDKLQNINVSEDTLQEFSRFGLWLEEQKVDAKAEDINVLYIDDDLRVIENYWIFAARPASKERNIEIIQNSKNKDPSSDEMIAFLKKFDEKYPAKYVRTGLVLFVTIENKDVLLSEISKEDIQILENISNVLLHSSSIKKSNSIISNWGSSTPNVHADMSRWAAERAGFNSNYVDIISNNAAAPDYFNPGTSLPHIYEQNYKHYYNPLGLGFGGAPHEINDYYALTRYGSTEERCVNLSYASHYMADLSMPLHTNYAVKQAARSVILDELEPHFAYENDYVGANWTTGYNFSRFSKDVTSGYIVQDPGFQGKELARYSNENINSRSYSDEAWDCGLNISEHGNNYTPSPTVFYATSYCIGEGQKYLIGLMQAGRQQMSQQTFTNQRDITLWFEEIDSTARELDLTNLRVSMGSGDSASINLDGCQVLRFVDSIRGGDLYIYDENGNQLGVISQVNGKTAYENMTFDVSFIHDGSMMTINLQKYHRGTLIDTFSYSYVKNTSMSKMRASMAGYQSNVDFISSQYDIYYQKSWTYSGGSFANNQSTTLQIDKNHFRVSEIDLKNLRVSMGSGDSASIYLNNKQILKFVDSARGGDLYIYNENGNQLGVISQVNGKTAYENMTFDVSFIHDGSRMTINIQKYYRGTLIDTFSYSYMTANDKSTLRTNMVGYQSNVDYISSQHRVFRDFTH
ncbi:hypothetical protein MmiEs2_13890 [Methanimicrococcus stummii]|uniref:Uncharacterized protein n=1 Tax=Methanimicrococcus stummii TaxID=3028294 RepID=A0AA96ZYR7_9EURY|nr:hypothetical protein [Methanimicrococcus sp. Es2]WNY29166.1 hypothetical protein MmiEs2_13890 [Methanimicrococcus sp. Es2]